MQLNCGKQTNKKLSQLKDGSKDIIGTAAERDKRWETWKRGWAMQNTTRASNQTQLEVQSEGEMQKNQSHSRKWLRISCYERYQSSDSESQQVPWRIQRNAHLDRLSHHRHLSLSLSHTHTHTHRLWSTRKETQHLRKRSS